jgi:hypothetical protein
MYQGLSLDQAPPEDIPFRFFLTAPLFGFVAGLLIVFDGMSLFTDNWDFRTIALTHLITLGWLTMVMFGAFYQIVPVLVGGRVPKVHSSRWLHLLFCVGIILFVSSLLSMQYGEFALGSDLFKVTATLLFISVGGILTQLIYSVFKVEINNRPTVVAMRISLLCLLLTLLLGISFVGNLSFWWVIPWDRVNITGIHLTFGLFGWVGTLIIGIGFHMIPMFYLTPPFDQTLAYRILRLHVLSLLLLPLALFFNLPIVGLMAAAIPGILGVVLFTGNLFLLIKKRKRRLLDGTMRFWQTGLVLLPLAILVIISNQWLQSSTLLIIFGLLFILGFGVVLTNGMLYKIFPFILWFHRYSSLIGKVKVPLLQDIAPDKYAQRQWITLVIALFLLVAGTFWQDDLTIRLAGVGFSLSSLMLFIQILTAFKLDVPEPLADN